MSCNIKKSCTSGSLTHFQSARDRHAGAKLTWPVVLHVSVEESVLFTACSAPRINHFNLLQIRRNTVPSGHNVTGTGAPTHSDAPSECQWREMFHLTDAETIRLRNLSVLRSAKLLSPLQRAM